MKSPLVNYILLALAVFTCFISAAPTPANVTDELVIHSKVASSAAAGGYRNAAYFVNW
jgi:hypothetical protein